MWALGCVFFELLSSRRAFNSASDLVARKLNTLPPNTDPDAVQVRG